MKETAMTMQDCIEAVENADINLCLLKALLEEVSEHFECEEDNAQLPFIATRIYELINTGFVLLDRAISDLQPVIERSKREEYAIHELLKETDEKQRACVLAFLRGMLQK